jgi:hypothetical protein
MYCKLLDYHYVIAVYINLIIINNYTRPHCVDNEKSILITIMLLEMGIEHSFV